MSATEPVTIGIRELRQNASRYIAMVEQGTDVYIARRGDTVVQMVPFHRKQDPLQELYDKGILEPARVAGDVLDVVPVKPSPGMSATEMLLQMREEERF